MDKTADIFRYVNFMLPYTTPNPLDQPILERIARIGIAPGKPWNLAEMKPEMRQAIEDGVADGLKLISETIPKVHDAAKLYLSREKMRTDYLNRTMGVVIGQWGNDTRQAVYQGWPLDAEGVPPDTGKNSYTITFPPGKLPEYQFFWSITMYGLPERLLVPNPLKRYSIGSDSPDLKMAADGSLVIYLQKNSPGRGQGRQLAARARLPVFRSLACVWPGRSRTSRPLESARPRTGGSESIHETRGDSHQTGTRLHRQSK